jgi:hypothetical protein
LLEDNDSQSVSKVAFWFSKEQAVEFSRIKDDQYLTYLGLRQGPLVVNGGGPRLTISGGKSLDQSF